MKATVVWTSVIALRVPKMSMSNEEQYGLKTKTEYQTRSEHRTRARRVGKIKNTEIWICVMHG
jgi:hypothetical protein